MIPIELPPLRERREDIPPLAAPPARAFAARAPAARCGSRPRRCSALLDYDWPGNVRELENALEFAATVCQGQTLQPEDLPPELQPSAARPMAPTDALWRGALQAPVAPPAAADERLSVQRALEEHRWSRAETARALGMSRSTLWRRMRALGLE